MSMGQMVPGTPDAKFIDITDHKAVAKDMMAKFDGGRGFVTAETLEGWIAGALKEAWDTATRREHDKIEKFIGTRKFQEIRAMVQRAHAKWGGQKNVSR